MFRRVVNSNCATRVGNGNVAVLAGATSTIDVISSPMTVNSVGLCAIAASPAPTCTSPSAPSLSANHQQPQFRAFATSRDLLASDDGSSKINMKNATQDKSANNTHKKENKKRAPPQIINTLNIGDVSLPILKGNNPERVASGLPPAALSFFNPSRPEALRYIRWLAQKDLLKQDVCIVGDPGPTKRWLAMLFAQFAGKEVQLLCLSRDTTEADIKQRKEIRDGTLYYVNQAAVTAALEGQLLIIDGLERAERNVLPVINNLLENREMHLDNGMMLIAPARYDQLCREHGVTDLTDWGLLRVSENFRVIGLTVPVPKYSGNPLDPPLRSRFQCLFLDQSGGGGQQGTASRGAAPTHLTYDVIPKAIRGTQPVEMMLKFRAVQNTVDNAGSDRDRARSFPAVTDFDICLWSTQHEQFPNEELGEILNRVYPIDLFIRNGPKAEQTVRRANMNHLLKRYGLYSEDCKTRLTEILASDSTNASEFPSATLKFTDGRDRVVPCGSLPLFSDPRAQHPLFLSEEEQQQRSASANKQKGGKSSSNSNGKKRPRKPSTDSKHNGTSDPTDDHTSFYTSAHRRAMNGVIQSHVCNRHMALVGSAGCGKTNLIRDFASLLGYEVETQHLFRDMSTRDLLQRRSTDPATGSTTWELSPLMLAVRHGRLAVLDGIDQLSPGALAVLQELLLDGNITLFDGTVFKNTAAFDALKETLGCASDAEMNARGIFRVHPSFRLIATARYPAGEGASSAKKNWLTSDLVPLLDWHVMPDLSTESVFKLLANVTRRFAVTYGGGSGATTRPEEAATAGEDNDDAADELLIPAASANLRASDVTADELVARQASREYQQVLAGLVELQHHLAEMSRTESKIPTLTLRQLRHIAKHVLVFPDDLFGIVESSLLLPLTSQLIAQQVKSAMAKYDIRDANAPPQRDTNESSRTQTRRGSRSPSPSTPSLSDLSSLARSSMRAGNPFEVIVEESNTSNNNGGAPAKKTVCKSFGHEVMHVTRQYSAKEKSLIPHVPSFHANRLQLTLQAWIAKNIASGNNILLVGNQGVGKNKIVDQLLAEVGLPRHYLQLHRDTTVSSLTINPSVVEGKVMWEDSPLVKAVQQGHVLVVDEIDKAPVEVVHILKGLIEDKEMRLGDGRKISSSSAAASSSASDPNVIPIHPDFRVIVLANPPGFPFHGNDFYRECGDLFSCFVVQNPDPSSQQELLQKIAPDVPAVLITKLIMVFTELGTLFAAGTIQYPFSLRELIAVVKHLQAFPRDGLYQALNNVFSFDLLNENTMNHVRRLLHQYVSPITLAQLRTGLGENRIAKETLLGKLLNMATFSVQPAVSVDGAIVDTKSPSASASSASSLVLKMEDKNKSTAVRYANIASKEDDGNNGADSGSGSSGSRPFTECLSALDFSALLHKGEVVVSARQLSGGCNAGGSVTLSGNGRTAVLTSHNRLLLLPTPTTTDGGIRDVTGFSLTGCGGENEAGNVTIVQLQTTTRKDPQQMRKRGKSEDDEEAGENDAVILGDSLALADAVLATSTANAVAAADQEAIVNLLTAPTPTSLRLTTVAVPANKNADATTTSSDSDLIDEKQKKLPIIAAATFSDVTAACTRLASEGCVAVATSKGTLTFLYYGRVVEVALNTIKTSSGSGTSPSSFFSKITRIDALSSQIFFVVGEAEGGSSSSSSSSSLPTCGFLKLSVFRDRAEAFFHKVGVADVPLPKSCCGKKPEEIDTRLRLSAAANLQLLVAEGLFAGYASGEGYVPTPGPITADNLSNALFVMRTEKNGGRIGPKDVLYATAQCEAVSEAGLLVVTMEGAVNRSDKTLQLIPANGATASSSSLPANGSAAASGTDTDTASSFSSSSSLLAAATTSSAWTKVSEYASAASALSGGAQATQTMASAGAIGSNAHSHSAHFGHHQLVAKDVSSSAVCVVSSQKGTIREFPTVSTDPALLRSAAGGYGAASLMNRVRSVFGSSTGSSAGNNASASSTAAADADFASTPSAFAPAAVSSPSAAQAAIAAADPSTLMTSVSPDGVGAAVSPSGVLSSFDTNAERLGESYSRWSSVLKGGIDDLGEPPTPEELNMWYSKPKKASDINNLKHGEEDPDNTPHSGGNNWAGGTGGTDTAGLGGMVGPYRLDKGHPVTQVDPAEKKKVPQHIVDEARRMGREALEKRLAEINMSVSEDERYRDAYERVQGPVQQLRSMLEGMRSKEKERAWARHQTDGVWDDAKLVEGVTGEKTVYKRRIESEDNLPFGKPEAKKRLLFVMDVSASMYRFNGMDQRLTKSVECAIMIMEAFKGHEDKIDYAIIGHNGDSGNLPLVPFGQPPTNKKQRMDVCMKMVAYSQFCWSGDNTVTAMENSVRLVTQEPADGYFVFVISDANFQQYGISPKHLSRIIKSNDAVHMFCIFIASIGQQAKAIQMQLPAGHGFECYDTTKLPIVLQQIFQSTDVLN